MICQNCNAELSGTPKFCPRCGTPLLQPVEPERQSKRCPQCGTENELSAKFCKHDGYRFDPQPSVTEEPESPAIQPESGPSASIEPAAIVAPPEEPPETPVTAAPATAEEAKPDTETAPPRICPRCGMPNASTALFCRKDGTPLTAAASASISTRDRNAESTSVPEPDRDRTITPATSSVPQSNRFLIPIAIVAMVALSAAGYFYMSSATPPVTDNMQPDNRQAQATDKPIDRAPPAAQVPAMTQANAAAESARTPPPAPQPAERATLPRPQDPAKAASVPPKDSPPPAALDEQPPIARVDAALVHQALSAQLARSGLGHLEVTVDSEGRAGLAGSVSSSAQKEAAIEIAFAQHGIEYVSDTDLKVVKPKAQSAPTTAPSPDGAPAAATRIDPAKLEGEINRALRAAGLGSIAAQVADDLSVTLRGSVTSSAQKTRAFQIAQSFKGVRATKDRIFVVN